MRTEVLTIKIPAEVMVDLDEYAKQEFPRNCPKCAGEGQLESSHVCPTCEGTGTVGNRSEASRFLLHYALGDRASPEARAMMAVYGEVRARLLSVVTKTAHKMVEDFREDMVRAIENTLDED